ncbi:MAG: glycoside hydrolase family 2 protein [Cellulomonas sp.]
MPRDIPSSASADDLHPRPQLVRDRWVDLCGVWQFEFDDDDAGLAGGWMCDGGRLPRSITVPFPPESSASGIGDPRLHRVMWYRRTLTVAEVSASGHGAGRILVLHFGAVDYRAQVWVAGDLVGHHEGGHTPFDVVVPWSGDEVDVVVRVEDDPHDLAQPRGKQDWAENRHIVWYDRTSGIWQPVWLESVPRQHITHLTWHPNLAEASVGLDVELSRCPVANTTLRVRLHLGKQTIASQTVTVAEARQTLTIALPGLRNGQCLDDYLWSPESPTLIAATVELEEPAQEPDAIRSYFGLRDIATGDGHLLLNGRPYEVRGVLSQGYWPASHLAAPSADALRAEVQLIKQLGFTTVRVHQKIEDPRFLAWADKLGLLVWAEMPSTYESSATATSRLVSEWMEVIRRDASHPSIVAWVPVNESWGVHHVAQVAQQREVLRALYHLTKALDSSRLVISNDGWEHTRSDLFTVHDYENDASRLQAAYSTPEATRHSLDGTAPNGRMMLVGTPEESAWTSAAPVVLSEFGGVSVEPPRGDGWGYQMVESPTHLHDHLSALFATVRSSEGLAGWCYTQLTDTAQETNGLVDENRVPKLPVATIRALVQGNHRPRPDQPVFGVRLEGLSG